MRALALSALLAFGLTIPTLADETGNAHQFTFTSIDGKPMKMSEFKGKTVLVVNTASQCGYTPQYTQLEAVYTKYKDKGFVIVGVPSNDFGGQEPGTNAEIKKFCTGNYDVDFPLTTKYEVKGPGAHPFYQWAESVGGKDAVPAWNFHKLLIGPDGKLVGEFPTKVKPDAPEVVHAIEAALSGAKG